MSKMELTGSSLLDALAPQDQALFMGRAEAVRFHAGHILYHPGDEVNYAYFPRFAAVISYHVIMADGSAVETGITGNEGAVGGIVSSGRLPAYSRCCVMHGGQFYRVACSDLEAAKEKSAPMRHLFTRYADCMLAQVFQSVACNASHSIEQRAAKWLLSAMDRIGTNMVAMTQEQLGSILGVGRSYVSRVIGRMKEAGSVETRRGGIIVTDRARLDQMSCDCNRLVGQHFETVLFSLYRN